MDDVHRLALLGVTTLLAATLAACGGSPNASAPRDATAPASGAASGSGTGPTGTPPSTPPTSAATPPSPAVVRRVRAYCTGLASTERVSRLSGVTMGTVEVQAVGATPGCTWTAADGSATTVEVVNASSSTWGAQLPGVAASLRDGGVVLGPTVESQLQQVDAALGRGQEVDADLACEIFGEIAALTGSADGADATVRLTPSGRPTTVTAQACSADEYSFVQLRLATPNGLPSRVPAVKALLGEVHDNITLHF